MAMHAMYFALLGARTRYVVSISSDSHVASASGFGLQSKGALEINPQNS